MTQGISRSTFPMTAATMQEARRLTEWGCELRMSDERGRREAFQEVKALLEKAAVKRALMNHPMTSGGSTGSFAGVPLDYYCARDLVQLVETGTKPFPGFHVS